MKSVEADSQDGQGEYAEKEYNSTSPNFTRTPRNPSSLSSSSSLTSNSSPTTSFNHEDGTLNTDLEKQSTKSVNKDDEVSLPTLPFSLTPTASSAPDVTYPEGGKEAWLVVLGSFTGMLCAFGLMNTIGTLQAYLSEHQLQGYTPSAIGWIFSIYIFLAFFCGLQIGPVFDAKGPRWLILAGSILILGGTFGLAESKEYWHFILAFSIAAGLGSSLIFTPAISAIAHFFSRKRGSATGLAATGGSIGGIVFPLMLPPLFSKVGWAWAIRVMGFIFLMLLIFANVFIRSRLPPKKNGSVWPDFRIFRDWKFALTTAGVFFMEWGLFIPLTFISSWAVQTGVGSQAFAFQLLAILNAASFFGRWMPGYIADKIGRFNTMLLAMGICFLSLICLFLPGSTSTSPRGSVPLAVVFALIFGFASGSGISLTPVCVGQLCDTEEYGRYYATCYTIVAVGCLTGVPIAGQLLEICQDEYGGLIAFTAACYGVGIACFWAARVIAVGWKLTAVY